MLLSEWSKESGILPTTPNDDNGSVSLILEFTDPLRRELWELEDYKVSSVNGIVIWLTPVRKSDIEATAYASGFTYGKKIAKLWTEASVKESVRHDQREWASCGVPEWNDELLTLWAEGCRDGFNTLRPEPTIEVK